jgi:hypothetical protein
MVCSFACASEKRGLCSQDVRRLETPEIKYLSPCSQKRRKEFKKILFKYDVHHASLFPDLDGLARHIEYCQTDTY